MDGYQQRWLSMAKLEKPQKQTSRNPIKKDSCNFVLQPFPEFFTGIISLIAVTYHGRFDEIFREFWNSTSLFWFWYLPVRKFTLCFASQLSCMLWVFRNCQNFLKKCLNFLVEIIFMSTIIKISNTFVKSAPEATLTLRTADILTFYFRFWIILKSKRSSIVEKLKVLVWFIFISPVGCSDKKLSSVKYNLHRSLIQFWWKNRCFMK